MSSKLKHFLSFKGIWTPLAVSTSFIVISFAAKTEEYFKFLQPIENVSMQYQDAFFFCCLPLFFINKVNFNYLNSQFNFRKSITNRLLLLFSLSIALTSISTIIGLIIFSLYKVPFSDVHLLKISSIIFLNALFYCMLFNYLLNIRNSMGFLFFIFFLPMIEIVGSFISRLFQLNIERFFPFKQGANSENLIVIILLLVAFTALSIKSHKSYYL